MPKKRYVVTLSTEERSYLQGLVSKGKVAVSKRLHAQILPKTDAGPQGEEAVASRNGLIMNTDTMGWPTFSCWLSRLRAGAT